MVGVELLTRPTRKWQARPCLGDGEHRHGTFQPVLREGVRTGLVDHGPGVVVFVLDTLTERSTVDVGD